MDGQFMGKWRYEFRYGHRVRECYRWRNVQGDPNKTNCVTLELLIYVGKTYCSRECAATDQKTTVMRSLDTRSIPVFNTTSKVFSDFRYNCTLENDNNMEEVNSFFPYKSTIVPMWTSKQIKFKNVFIETFT